MTDPSKESPADFAQAAKEFAEARGVLPTLHAVVSNAVGLLHCDWAAVVAADRVGSRRPRFSAANDEALAAVIADIAGTAGDSPGISALRDGRVVVCNTLATETRFPEYAREITRRTTIRSVMSIPLRLHQASLGVLSCYSARPSAFDEQAIETGRTLAVHAVVAVVAAREEVRADNLEISQLSTRTIGAAIGILMERYRVSPDNAFAALRGISQRSNRPLALLAAELVETGSVDGLDAAVAQTVTAEAGPSRLEQ